MNHAFLLISPEQRYKNDRPSTEAIDAHDSQRRVSLFVHAGHVVRRARGWATGAGPRRDAGSSTAEPHGSTLSARRRAIPDLQLSRNRRVDSVPALRAVQMDP